MALLWHRGGGPLLHYGPNQELPGRDVSSLVPAWVPATLTQAGTLGRRPCSTRPGERLAGGRATGQMSLRASLCSVPRTLSWVLGWQ